MNDANETERAALPETVRDLHDRYVAEGAAWRDHLPFTASETVPKLLRAVRQHMISQDAPLSGATIHPGASEMTSPSIAPTTVPATRAKMQRRTRIIIASSAVTALLIIVGTVSIALQRPQLIIDLGVPPPPFYHWSATNVTSTMTPQQAFAHGVTLTPCSGKPATSLDVTWIATNARFGLAMIQGNCSYGSNPRILVIFEMTKEETGFWKPELIGGTGWPQEISTKGVSQTPGWLPLPQNKYSSFVSTGDSSQPGVFSRGWVSNQNYFLGGSIADQAIRPSDSLSVSIANQSGWMGQHFGLTIIVIPNTPHQTYFFISNFSSQQTQIVANAMLMHVVEWPSIT